MSSEGQVEKTVDHSSLIDRIVAGEKSAEQELVNTYWRGLTFILNRRAQNPDLAADIAQDTFIVVIQKARTNSINNHDALAAYIRQTGVNLLIGHYRKEKRRDTSTVEDIDIHAPADGMDISRALHSEKVLAIVQQVMEELKVERDRELLRSYFVYDKSKQQICHDLELSAEHFDRVLFRARQRLKQLIEHKLSNKNNTNGSAATLLGIGLLLLSISNPPANKNNLYVFVFQVRDIAKPTHLITETPKTSSRSLFAFKIPESEWVGKPLTPKSRCA